MSDLAERIKKYRDHINYLCKQMHVVVTQAPGLPGMMYVEENPPRIAIPLIDHIAYFTHNVLLYPADPQAKYFVALHELGHVRHEHTQGRPPAKDRQFYFTNGVLKSEVQAWEFAFKQCCDEITESTREFALRCFISYREDAILNKDKYCTLVNGDRFHVQFKYDDPYSEDVTKLLDRLSAIKQPA